MADAAGTRTVTREHFIVRPNHPRDLTSWVETGTFRQAPGDDRWTPRPALLKHGR